MMGSFSYKEMPKRIITCPTCIGETFTVLARQDRYKMGIETVHCATCGLIMTNPMPTKEALGEFYTKHYRTFYRRTDSPTFDYLRQHELVRRASYSVDYLDKHSVIQDGAEILDVGCGEGSILKELRVRHPQARVVGIEPGKGFAKFAASYVGCPVLPDLQSLDPGAVFDLIIVNHVLEHASNPVLFLKELRNRISDDGTIYVDVPDVSQYSSIADLHLAHLYHFSKSTLGEIARKAGLMPVALEQHHPPRHPPSIRCFLKREDSALELQNISTRAVANEASNHNKVKAINATAWLYHLRRSLLGKLFIGVPCRLWRSFLRKGCSDARIL
jgi:2-polyprenyl-3-methyl-5-hydroxy-6-metoxy-1,4-benzoquinol methylase